MNVKDIIDLHIKNGKFWRSTQIVKVSLTRKLGCFDVFDVKICLIENVTKS